MVPGAGGDGGIPGAPVSKPHSSALQRTETGLKYCPCLNKRDVEAPHIALCGSRCMGIVSSSLYKEKFPQIPGNHSVFTTQEIRWARVPLPVLCA